jgi:hypothetical protein
MLPPDTTQSLILGIDRILIHTQDVERVFARFRYEFGLPVAWPITDCGLLVSGGLHAGNMNIEIGRFAGFGLPGTWFYGLGLAPLQPTWKTVNGLVSRKVLHTPPVTLHYEEPVAMRSTLTFLGNLLDDQPNTPFWLGRTWGGNSRVCRALAALSTWMVGTEAGSMAFSKLLGSSAVFMCDNQIEGQLAEDATERTVWNHRNCSSRYRGCYQHCQLGETSGSIGFADKFDPFFQHGTAASISCRWEKPIARHRVFMCRSRINRSEAY